MSRTPFNASALTFAFLIAVGTAACSGGPRHARSSPTPEPVAPLPDSAPAAVAVEPEKVDEALDLERVQNATVGRELLGSATYDLPVEPNQWVAMELSFLVNQRHDVVGRWLERGERYSSFVQETFAAAGIPKDLFHLAMIESGFQPTARSHAGAVGLWQFMSATGRGMGLRIDDQVDERMDPVRSTRAAARHLRQLYGDFGGNWALAAAAYNAGGGRISRGLASYGATDFWDLATRGNLAQETRRYVPRLYAVTIIAKDPARFGYARSAGVVQRFEFDSLQVDLPTPLPVIARVGNIPVSQLADLNPHLVRGMVPSYYWLWVPKGQAAGMQQAWAASDYRRRGGYQMYTLRRGEDAQKIALASNLSMDQLRELNLSTNLGELGRGDRIRLYADAARALDSRPVERVASRDDSDESTTRRRTRRASDDDGDETSSRRSTRASSDDAEESSTRRRTRSSDDDSSTRRSSDDDSSSRRSRTASSGDDSSARRRISPSDDDSSTRRRTASSDDQSSSTRRSGTSSGDDSSRRRTVSSDDQSSSTRRSSTSSGDESSARRRTASSDDAEPSARRVASRAADGDASSRRRESSASRQEESTSSRSSIVRHTVEAGETLMAIGRKYSVTVAQLLEANDLRASAVLQPGQRLRIPSASLQRVASTERTETRTTPARRETSETRPAERRETSETRTTQSRPSSETRPTERRTASSESSASSRSARQHVVKSGETLWSIARSYDTTVAAIREANDMRADSVLQPGQTLRIPRPAAARSSDR